VRTAALSLFLLLAIPAAAQAPPPVPPAEPSEGLAEQRDEEIPATRLIYLPGRFAPSCPHEVEVQESIARRIGRSPFAEPAERIVVLALEGEGEVPVRARSELFDAGFESIGARVLESDEGCAELVEAAALAISIALAPESALRAPDPPPPPPPVPPPPPLEEEDIVEEPTVTLEPPSWLPEGAVLVVGAGGSAAFFFGPQSSTGFHTTIGMRFPELELRLEQRQLLPNIDGNLGILHGGSAYSLLPCAHVPLFPLRGDGDQAGIAACASASVGSVWSLGNYVGGSFYTGLGGRVAAEWTQSDFSAFRAWAGAEWSAVRPTFRAFDGAIFWEQESVVNIAAGVTYEISWPP
jgi:hypothetical protein